MTAKFAILETILAICAVFLHKCYQCIQYSVIRCVIDFESFVASDTDNNLSIYTEL